MRLRSYRRIVRLVRTRRRPLLLTIGALLIVLSMALPSSIAFIAGFLVIGLGAPDALPCTPTTALVRLWEAPRTSQSDHAGTRIGRRQWFGGKRKRSR